MKRFHHLDEGKGRQRKAKHAKAHCQDAPPRHNVGMNNAEEALEGRLVNLEVKLGFMEDLVEELNHIVVRQQRHIDLLVREVTALRDQLGENTPGTFRSLRDELPPHY